MLRRADASVLHGFVELTQPQSREHTARFDQQADRFDRRTGLPPTAAREVARALMRVASVSDRDPLLEIGAGTGALGCELMALGAAYVGIDLSRPMLDVFRRKLGGGQRGLLVMADAERGWPVRDRSVAVVFASRSAHLLSATHAADEVRRVCRPGGRFLVGRVAREPDSIKTRLREERLRMLAAGGAARGGGERRSGRGEDRRLLERCQAVGAVALPDQTVATWIDTTSPEDVIREWEALDPHALPFSALRAWARQEFGDLQRAEPFTERYTLQGVRFPTRADQHPARPA